MRRLGKHPTLRAFFGTLYIQMGTAAPARLSHFFALGILLAALAILPGFYNAGRDIGDFSGANLVIFLLCVLNAEYRINPHATLMLNIGRRDRFRSLLFSALSQWLVVAAVAALLAAVSIAAGHFIDEVTLYGITHSYDPMSPKAFLVFAPMLPFLFLSQMIFPKQHIIFVIFVATIATVSFMTVGYKLLDDPWSWLLLMQAVCWLPFVVVARYHCYSLDLKLTEK
jgi:ABC-type Na+ efflux pump permease subunit